MVGTMTGSPFSAPEPYGSGSGTIAQANKGPVSAKSTSPISVASTAGTKRKRGEPKFYSVQVGHNPGIYYNWADCLEQVKGFKKATCEYSRTWQ